MSILGSVGSLYMLILILLLIVGFGMVGLWLINLILTPLKASKATAMNKETNKTIGGIYMNSWLRLALFSFVGIIISMAVLAFISPGGVFGTSNMMGTGYQYQQHAGMNVTGSAGTGGMSMQSSMPPSTSNTGSMSMMDDGMDMLSMMGMPMGSTTTTTNNMQGMNGMGMM